VLPLSCAAHLGAIGPHRRALAAFEVLTEVARRHVGRAAAQCGAQRTVGSARGRGGEPAADRWTCGALTVSVCRPGFPSASESGARRTGSDVRGMRAGSGSVESISDSSVACASPRLLSGCFRHVPCGQTVK
jgi:hypothetical protein